MNNLIWWVLYILNGVCACLLLIFLGPKIAVPLVLMFVCSFYLERFARNRSYDP